MGRNIVAGPEVGRWVTRRAGGQFSPEAATAIGLETDGKIVAGVMYENCNGRSLVAHMAIEGRLTRYFIWAIFDYAFRQNGVNKVILPVPSTNTKSIRFVKHLGFSEECRIKDAAPHGDIIIYTLEKSECRFLGDKYGKA